MKHLILCAAILAGTWSCSVDIPGVAPPEQTLYFPADVVATNDGERLWIVNTNFDFRFNAGWIAEVLVDDLRNASDPASAIMSQLKILSLGGPLSRDASGTRAAIAHRDRNAITLFDVDADVLTCGDPAATSGLDTEERRTDCDAAHFLEIEPRNFRLEVSEEVLPDPYTIHFVERDVVGSPFVGMLIGHLGINRISVLRNARSFAEGFDLSLDQTLSTAQGRIDGLAEIPGATGPLFAALSQFAAVRNGATINVSTLYTFDLARVATDTAAEVEAHPTRAEISGINAGDFLFRPDGARAYVASQSLDALIVLDATTETIRTPNTSGVFSTREVPRFSELSAIPTPGDPGRLRWLSRGDGRDFLLAVNLEAGTISVFSSRGDQLALVRRLETMGEGPFGMAVFMHRGVWKLAVVTFRDHGLSLFDVDATEPADWFLEVRLQSTSQEGVP